MIARIGKTYEFEAAHQLHNHGGKCARLHGHNYTARVEIEGEVNATAGDPDEGMVVDFFDLDAIWAEHLEPKLDHQFLNDTLDVPVTTAENIAAWIALQVTCFLPPGRGCHVAAVIVHETPRCFARVEMGVGGVGTP